MQAPARVRRLVAMMAAAGIGLLPAGVAAAAPLTGEAEVRDAGRLLVDGHELRIAGIDAPPTTAACTAAGNRWRCGRIAALALAERMAGEVVSCEPLLRGVVCRVGDDDVGGWLLEQGWARSGNDALPGYAAAEQRAREGRRGIWRDGFVPGNWADAAVDDDSSCSVCAARHRRLGSDSGVAPDS